MGFGSAIGLNVGIPKEEEEKPRTRIVSRMGFGEKLFYLIACINEADFARGQLRRLRRWKGRCVRGCSELVPDSHQFLTNITRPRKERMRLIRMSR